MKRTATYLGVLLLALTGSGTASAVTASVVPSRTSCVAPCFVYFDATASDSNGNGTAGDWLTDLVDAYFSWNFGDATAAGETWAHGARSTSGTPLSKNKEVGFVAGHVFEQAGDYTVQLDITNKTGASGGASTVIHVSAWGSSNGPTYCFSASGSFTGCPSGSVQVTSGDFDADVATCTNNGSRAARCLFRGGDTFAVSQPAGQLPAGPGILASGDFYGFGAGRAVVNVASNSVLSHQTDWRIFGFKFDGGNTAGGVAGDDRTKTHVLYWNNEVTRFTGNSYGEIGDHSGMIDNYIHDMGQYCWIGALGHGAQLGNYCLRASRTANQHAFRSEWYPFSAIAHNRVEDYGTHDGWKINSHDQQTVNRDQGIWIFDNECRPGSTLSACFSVGPQYSSANEPVDDVIVDSNLVMPLATVTSDGGPSAPIDLKNVLNGIVRNNFMVPVNEWAQQIMIESYSGARAASGNRIIGNSVWASRSDGFASNVYVSKDAATTGSLFQDNLAYCSNQWSGTLVSCGGASCTATNNLRATTNPFLTTAPVTMDDVRIGQSSSAANQGVTTVGLVVDAFGGLRIGSTLDVGADEYGAPQADGSASAPPPPPVLLSSGN